jgi:hypothetical protein
LDFFAEAFWKVTFLDDEDTSFLAAKEASPKFLCSHPDQEGEPEPWRRSTKIVFAYPRSIGVGGRRFRVGDEVPYQQ